MKKLIRGAVLGFPIEHSLSPILHNKAFELLGISGSYTAIEVKNGELKDFLKTESKNFDYLSLTMPLKEEALLLEGAISLEIDELGRRIQSINTLVGITDTWQATSTDGSGFVKALASRGYHTFERVLILGAGGTARAIAAALDNIALSVDVMGRSVRRNSAISQCFTKIDCNFIVWNDLHDLRDYDLVINTTPAGAADLVAENLPHGLSAIFFDVLYKPWPTLLARRWSDSGGAIIGGLDLLLYQGIDQLNLVTSLGAQTFAQELRLALTDALI